MGSTVARVVLASVVQVMVVSVHAQAAQGVPTRGCEVEAEVAFEALRMELPTGLVVRAQPALRAAIRLRSGDAQVRLLAPLEVPLIAEASAAPATAERPRAERRRGRGRRVEVPTSYTFPADQLLYTRDALQVTLAHEVSVQAGTLTLPAGLVVSDWREIENGYVGSVALGDGITLLGVELQCTDLAIAAAPNMPSATPALQAPTRAAGPVLHARHQRIHLFRERGAASFVTLNVNESILFAEFERRPDWVRVAAHAGAVELAGWARPWDFAEPDRQVTMRGLRPR